MEFTPKTLDDLKQIVYRILKYHIPASAIKSFDDFLTLVKNNGALWTRALAGMNLTIPEGGSREDALVEQFKLVYEAYRARPVLTRVQAETLLAGYGTVEELGDGFAVVVSHTVSGNFIDGLKGHVNTVELNSTSRGLRIAIWK